MGRSPLDVTVSGSAPGIMADEVVLWETAITTAVGDIGAEIQKNWRGQIMAAGLGRKLAGAIRVNNYPVGAVSASAATFVSTNADRILTGHDEGSLITAKDGFWLAIPTEAAGHAGKLGKLTPHEWEMRRGARLQFVYRPGRPSLLVIEGGVSKKKGLARGRKRVRLKSGRYAKNVQTVPIFILLPQVKLPKRLNLQEGAKITAGRLDQQILTNYRRLA